MNKKLLLLLAGALILTSCTGGQKTEDDYEYEDPTIEQDDIFDYENKTDLGDWLADTFLLTEQSITGENLEGLLSVLNSNDFYANKVIHTQINQVLYPDSDDVDNPESRTDGDIDYSMVNSLVRNNTTYTISGASIIHDERWVYNEENPPQLDHTSIDASGTYLLQRSQEDSTYVEAFDYDVETYNSSIEKTYNASQYFLKTNLTRSSEIAEHLVSTIDYVNYQNEVRAPANRFTVSFEAFCNTSSTEVEIRYLAQANQTTEEGDDFEVTYLIDIQIDDGMISSSSYLYTEIEKGDDDYLLRKVEDTRQYFVL